MVTGDSMAYTGGTTHRPLPTTLPPVRAPHTERKPKPTGLDWSNLARRCSLCGETKPGRLTDGACADCAPHLAAASLIELAPAPAKRNRPDVYTPEQLDDRFTGPSRTVPVDDVQPDHEPDDELGGWRVQRMAGFNLSKAWAAQAPGCPEGSHPTRDCGCHVFATPAEARSYIAWQLAGCPETPSPLEPLPVRGDGADDQPSSGKPSANGPARAGSSGEGPITPRVKAKVRQASPDDVLITLRAPGIAARTTDVAALLADLLAGLNKTPEQAAATDPTPPARAKREGGDRKGKPAPSSRAPRRTPTSTFKLEEARSLYAAGYTMPKIAETLGTTPATVRRQLIKAGVQLRDDRAGNSGGANKIDDPQTLVDQVRDLYTSGLTMAQVGEQLDTSEKVISRIMRRHNIQRRPHAFTSEGHPRRDNAGALKARIVALGVTSYEIKHWALAQGLIDAIHRGVPGADLVDAYTAAHPTTEKEHHTA